MSGDEIMMYAEMEEWIFKRLHTREYNKYEKTLFFLWQIRVSLRVIYSGGKKLSAGSRM